MNGNQTVACDHTLEKIPEINTDTYDTEFALRDALMAWAEPVIGKEFSEKETYDKGQELEKIYTEAFAKDKYAKHMPFSSKTIAKVFGDVDFRFGPDMMNLSNCRTYAMFCTTAIVDPLTVSGFILHEFFKIYVSGFIYNPLCDAFLLEKVGDTAFWFKVYEGSNQSYGEMWDENLTVLDNDNGKRPLVPFKLMTLAKNLDFLYGNKLETKTNFENFAGIKDLGNRIKEMNFLFGFALVGDKNAEREIKEFFGFIEQFNEIYKGVIQPKRNMLPILEYARIFDYFKVKSTTQNQTATQNTEAAQQK